MEAGPHSEEVNTPTPRDAKPFQTQNRAAEGAREARQEQEGSIPLFTGISLFDMPLHCKAGQGNGRQGRCGLGSQKIGPPLIFSLRLHSTRSREQQPIGVTCWDLTVLLVPALLGSVCFSLHLSLATPSRCWSAVYFPSRPVLPQMTTAFAGISVKVCSSPL